MATEHEGSGTDHASEGLVERSALLGAPTPPPQVAVAAARPFAMLKIALAAAVAALALVFVPNAAAASFDPIVQDAKDGQIDGAYSKADLNAALSSPLLKTYGGKNGVNAVKSALGGQTDTTTGSGDLPFTGAEMITFVALGSTLLIAGFVLRRDRPDRRA